MASVLLTFTILTMSFADDLEYGKAYRRDHAVFQDVLNGTATAPSQYRVGVLKVADFLGHHTPLPMRHWLTLIAMGSAFVAVFTLFSLLRRSAVWLHASRTERWFGAISYVFLVHYYFGWVTYFQRPETMPTAALVALVLLLITPSGTERASRSSFFIAAAIVLLGFLQGFVRADVALGLHAGILLYCASTRADGLALSRIPQAFTSLAAAGAAFAVQFYMVHVVYPKANYGSTAKIQLELNITSPGEWTAFILFILPFAWTVWRAFRHRGMEIAAPARAALYGSLVYFSLWFTFGRMEEVRIFLPLALAVAPLTVALAMQSFFPVGARRQMA